MGAFQNAFKSLKLWQIGVLAAALLGTAGATYGVYTLVSGSGEAGLAEDQQLIPVQYGDLVNEVSTNGSLIFPNRETLAFGTQGTVGEVLVEEGQLVKEGQPLVRLDAATVSSLEKAVAQARVNLRNAEDALAEAKDPHTDLEVAQAEASVANAKLSLDSAEEALARLLQPTAEDIAKAEAAVTSAKLSLKNAQETLDEIKTGASDDDIAKAQSAVDSASTSLANALGDLSLAQKEWDDKVQTAQDTFAAALEGYQDVFNKWLGIEIGENEVNLDPDALLDSWGVDLPSLFDPNLRFQDVSKWFWAEGPPPDDPATPWSEPMVYSWLNFFPGSMSPICEDEVVPSQGICIEKGMDDAWDTYQKAQDNLDTVETQAAKAIANAESAVTRAEESLAATQEALADLKEGPDSLEIEDKENQLKLALATLQKAEEELAQFTDPDPLEVEAKQKQVAVAQASLAKAEEDLAELVGSVDALEVALREAEVTSASEGLATAVEHLEGATLKAPMAGTVSLVKVEAGQTINANAAVIEIVDPTVIEVDGIVDEIDVLFIQEGARATVTMDALLGQVLEGTVSDISSAATSQQGVVSYPIRIQLEAPEGVELYEGLSATASIVLREERNVLLVPLQAVYGTFQEPMVRVMTDGGVEERGVVLGNSDDFWVVVPEGLAEGDQVVMEMGSAATSGDMRDMMRGMMPPGGVTGGGGQGQHR